MTRPTLEIVAIEQAAQCAGELFAQDRAGVTILQRDFLTVTPEETGLFDAVIMNPPFHMRADIAHIKHAVQFLKPGGRLAALCMDTHHRELALKHQSETWEHIPAGAFKSSGTGIACVMLSMIKPDGQPSTVP